MPADWDPPAPAWQSRWAADEEPLVVGYFGIQASAPGPLVTWARAAFRGANAPDAVEQGRYVDQQGVDNFIYIAYWRQSAYQAWWEKPESSDWWRSDERLAESAGYWREVFNMPLDHLETLHSTEAPHGVGVLTSAVEGPILEHGYPGGMRDRIALSGEENLKATVSLNAPLPAATAGGGRRVQVTPPQYMCVIRSGQNWSLCGEEERAFYLDRVQPVLLKGMDYLRDNPRESQCYSLRYVQKTDGDWIPVQQTFGLGYASDVHAFEEWAKNHPTHVAIFNRFMQMVEQFGEAMRLRLWHEVSVLPGQGCECEYIDCHADTGILRYSRRA
jgi:aldoxime dehydratase